MADKVSLLGTIGTWIATFLAIIALLGIVGPFLVYRATKTARYAALRAVDDPGNEYIGRGLQVWPDKYMLRKVRAPLLTEAPNLKSLSPKAIAKNTTQKRSRTSWILFDAALHIYDINTLRGESLTIYQRETFLPIHRHWILILGVLGRYSHRPDFGTAVNLRTGFELPDGFRNYNGAYILSGLTGLILPSPYHADGPTCRMLFHMHLGGQMEDLTEDPMELRTLLNLYLGYLSISGSRLLHTKIPWSYRGHRVVSESYRMLRIVKRSDTNAGPLQALLKELQLPVAEVLELQGDEPTTIEIEDMKKYTKGKLNTYEQEFLPESPYLALERDYVYKSTAYIVLLAILELQYSPFSFLNGMLGDDGKTSIHLVYGIIQSSHADPASLKSIIRLALAIADDLNVSDLIKTELTSKLQELPEYVPKFGRTNVRSLYNFDDFLRAHFNVASKPNRMISIIAMAHPESLMNTLEAMRHDMSSAKNSALVIDLQNHLVKVPWYWNSFLKFHFNAGEVFGVSHEAEINALKAQHGAALAVPFPEVIIACLQAKIRLALLCATIDPTPLSGFLNMIDDLVYVASSPKSVRSGQEVTQRQATTDEDGLAAAENARYAYDDESV
jgi:hypothetical protein